MLNELGLTKGEVVRYAVFPQIFPRLKKLFGTGFTYIPLFILIVFNTLKIIPDSHPFLRKGQQGKYSVFQVLAVAANNITFDRKNLDKVTIFGVVLAGLAMIVLQLLLCILALIAAPAYAYSGPGLGPTTIPAFFNNATPDTDLAFRVLDLIFGIPGIFTTTTQTTPFHLGLHALLEFYSYGILLVGTFVIIYLVTAIVLETAESGVPFGQRFNKAWVPVRIILFFGLLLPTGNGINAAQYILLNAAKLGSNLATNGWILFDQTVRGPYVANANELIARPSMTDLDSVAGFMAVAKTCAWAEGRTNGYDIKPYFVYTSGSAASKSYDLFDGSTPAFVDLVSRSQGGTLFIRYGVQDAKLYPNELGTVFPYCGELTLTIVDQGQPGAAYMQQAYLGLLSCLWSGNSGGLGACNVQAFDNMADDFTKRYLMVDSSNPYPDLTPYVGGTQKTAILQQMTKQMEDALTQAIIRQQAQGSWARDPAQNLGWAGAGIWFNKIAEQNGAVTAAVIAKPDVKSMPYVMEYIRDEKMKEDHNVSSKTAYTPVLSSGKLIEFEVPNDRDISLVLNRVYQYWVSEDSTSVMGTPGNGTTTRASIVPESADKSLTGNIIIDTMNVFLGTKGLFDMCKNTDIHPLAQLSSMGKIMIDHSIRGFAIAFGVGVGASIAQILEKHNLKQVLSSATSFFISIASIGFIAGFLMYYVLPFLPFIYFFFAVMTWAKSIFEAMVGMPLWALAHLRIDGQGMPGEAAAHGYFYIFEIFLRPICILIGFLGGIIIFSAMVKVLNSIFYLVLANLTGHDLSGSNNITGCFLPPGASSTGGSGGPGATNQNQLDYIRGIVDQFFYTVIYAILVYIMAVPCFKMVDLVPDGIMRWFGSGISPLGAQDGDDVQGLMKYVAGGIGLLAGKGRSLGGAFLRPLK